MLLCEFLFLKLYLFALFAILDSTLLGLGSIHCILLYDHGSRHWLSLARDVLGALFGVGRCIHGLEGGETVL